MYTYILLLYYNEILVCIRNLNLPYNEFKENFEVEKNNLARFKNLYQKDMENAYTLISHTHIWI